MVTTRLLAPDANTAGQWVSLLKLSRRKPAAPTTLLDVLRQRGLNRIVGDTIPEVISTILQAWPNDALSASSTVNDTICMWPQCDLDRIDRSKLCTKHNEADPQYIELLRQVD